MHILRVADIPREVAGGMHGYMANSARVLAADGHAVDYLFTEDLAPGIPRVLRRLLVLPVRVLGGRRRGRAFDVVEIHEPLGAPYALLARLPGSGFRPRPCSPMDWSRGDGAPTGSPPAATESGCR